jgi:hypothetical protein
MRPGAAHLAGALLEIKRALTGMSEMMYTLAGSKKMEPAPPGARVTGRGCTGLCRDARFSNLCS